MHAAQATRDATATVAQYAPLVMRLARQLVAKLPPSVELDDIVQAGMIGLMDAASRFEPEHGAKFETFATQRVRGAMLDELRQGDWAPRAVRRNQRGIDEAIGTLEQRLGRAPHEREIARELGVTLAQYRGMLAEVHGGQILSYDELEAGDDAHLGHQHADPAPDPLALLEERRFRETLVKGIEDLPERERQVMALYYQEDLNFREIAAVLGVTESRICQVHTQAIARLRARVRDQ